jgi:hypothetical protein
VGPEQRDARPVRAALIGDGEECAKLAQLGLHATVRPVAKAESLAKRAKPPLGRRCDESPQVTKSLVAAMIHGEFRRSRSPRSRR